MQVEAAYHTQGQDDQAVAADYICTIENWFIEVRGRGVQWSPADGARARSWYALGLPVGTVLRVLQARIKAHRFAHGPTTSAPMHLGWYEPAVLEQGRHLVRRGLGATLEAADAPTDTTCTDLLDALPALRAAATHVGTVKALDKAFAILDAGLQGQPDAEDEAPVQPPTLPQDAEVDLLLERCARAMTRTLLAGLDERETQDLQDTAQALLAPFRGSMGKKALAMRASAVQAQLLGARFGLALPTRAGWVTPGQSE